MRVCSSPTRSNWPSCSDAQQLALQVDRDFADFVDEQRAAVGQFEARRRGRAARRNAPLSVAEEFALEQFARYRRAVDPDQRPALRALAAWIARAISSLPVPDSAPRLSTLASVGATSSICRKNASGSRRCGRSGAMIAARCGSLPLGDTHSPAPACCRSRSTLVRGARRSFFVGFAALGNVAEYDDGADQAGRRSRIGVDVQSTQNGGAVLSARTLHGRLDGPRRRGTPHKSGTARRDSAGRSACVADAPCACISLPTSLFRPPAQQALGGGVEQRSSCPPRVDTGVMPSPAALVG